MNQVDEARKYFELRHSAKGSKWGFTDGKPNGKRTAGVDQIKGAVKGKMEAAKKAVSSFLEKNTTTVETFKGRTTGETTVYTTTPNGKTTKKTITEVYREIPKTKITGIKSFIQDFLNRNTTSVTTMKSVLTGGTHVIVEKPKKNK